MEIINEIKGGIGWITLNRPQALNAISLPMARELARLLMEWEETPSLKAVVIQGAGDKAFCAGGDIRALYEAKKEGDLKTCDAFFREEYALTSHIYQYPKPYLALIDGIAMGGGMGVSINGSHRIVTEKALLAMPETGIGFFPDVCATTFLNKTPGHTGLYLGLTGTRIKACDAMWTGLATHYIPSPQLPYFKDDLLKGAPLEDCLLTYCQSPLEKGYLEHHYLDIETHFNKTTLLEIVQSLQKDPSPFAQNTYNTLMSKSPTSLAVVFRQLKEGALLSFEKKMEQEIHLSQCFLEGHDFMEGIRSVLIQKDHLPRWTPATLEEINEKDIDSFFLSSSGT